jgi:hypothetical protein
VKKSSAISQSPISQKMQFLCDFTLKNKAFLFFDALALGVVLDFFQISITKKK